MGMGLGRGSRTRIVAGGRQAFRLLFNTSYFAYTVAMLRRLWMAIYRGFFWTYERGSWQYDIMCALIVIFILLTPRHWFQDRPREYPSGAPVALIRQEKSQTIYQLRADLLEKTNDPSLKDGAERVLRSFTGKSLEVTHIEKRVDSHGQVSSYAVWARE